MFHAKNYETASAFVKVIQRKLLASFFRTRCKGCQIAFIWNGCLSAIMPWHTGHVSWLTFMFHRARYRIL